MEKATIRLEHMMDRAGPVNRWILECPHGLWFADEREGGFPPTSVLLPTHDKQHDRSCTRELWDAYRLDGTDQIAQDRRPHDHATGRE